MTHASPHDRDRTWCICPGCGNSYSAGELLVHLAECARRLRDTLNASQEALRLCLPYICGVEGGPIHDVNMAMERIRNVGT